MRVVDRKGADMRRLTRAALAMIVLFFAVGMVIAREWGSPSGRYSGMQIVFAANTPPTSYRARIVDIDGSNHQDLKVHYGFLCSPNGNYFAFLDDARGWRVGRADGTDLRDIEIDDSAVLGLALLDNGEAVGLKRGIDGRHLSFIAEGDSSDRNWLRLPTFGVPFF